MRLETLSVRDRFLFHPVVGLHYETTAVQLRSFSAGVRTLLSGYDNVDLASVRVRFVRFCGCRDFRLRVCPDWNNFLEIQEELLYGVMDMVQKVGAAIALPSQTLYLATDKSDKLGISPVAKPRTLP
jgi:MscS family membrane protein